MTIVLHIDASVRHDRSLSRKLSQAFVDTWLAHRPHDTVLRRNIGHQPPPFVTESWIAAAFTPPDARFPAMAAELAASDKYIEELEQADLIVMGTPLCNCGMPANLKAWFDQVIRVGRTFPFGLARGNWPLEPVLGGKTLVLLTHPPASAAPPAHAPPASSSPHPSSSLPLHPLKSWSLR